MNLKQRNEWYAKIADKYGYTIYKKETSGHNGNYCTFNDKVCVGLWDKKFRVHSKYIRNRNVYSGKITKTKLGRKIIENKIVELIGD
jgi:hypothetical protein